MLALVSCKKFHPNTLRVVDFGENIITTKDAEEKLDNFKAMECILCGPCSHVEMSWRGWYTVHSMHETPFEAGNAGRELCEQQPNTFKPTALPTE